MEINTILAIICVVSLLFMLMNAYHKPTTISATKVVATQPNAYVVHTNPVYYPHYNPYKAQYYN